MCQVLTLQAKQKLLSQSISYLFVSEVCLVLLLLRFQEQNFHFYTHTALSERSYITKYHMSGTERKL